MLGAPKSLPLTKDPALSSEPISNSNGSFLSPQPLLHPHTGVSDRQEESYVPWAAALASSAPNAQEEEPWQKVGMSRRKPVSQPGASEASTRKTQKQGRGGHDQDQPGPPSVKVPTTVRQSKQALQRSEKAVAMPSHAQPVHRAAEQSPDWPHASIGSQSQQPSQHALASLQLLRAQHEILQPKPSRVAPEEAHAASQHTARSDSPAGSSLHEQVHIWPGQDLLQTGLLSLLV